MPTQEPVKKSRLSGQVDLWMRHRKREPEPAQPVPRRASAAQRGARRRHGNPRRLAVDSGLRSPTEHARGSGSPAELLPTVTGVENTQAQSDGSRDLIRVLELLDGDQTGAISVSALRDLGVKAPAQAVYNLQLAGYAIDRVSFTDQSGHRTLGYRLAVAPAADDQ